MHALATRRFDRVCHPSQRRKKISRAPAQGRSGVPRKRVRRGELGDQKNILQKFKQGERGNLLLNRRKMARVEVPSFWKKKSNFPAGGLNKEVRRGGRTLRGPTIAGKKKKGVYFIQALGKWKEIVSLATKRGVLRKVGPSWTKIKRPTRRRRNEIQQQHNGGERYKGASVWLGLQRCTNQRGRRLLTGSKKCREIAKHVSNPGKRGGASNVPANEKDEPPA